MKIFIIFFNKIYVKNIYCVVYNAALWSPIGFFEEFEVFSIGMLISLLNILSYKQKYPLTPWVIWNFTKKMSFFLTLLSNGTSVFKSDFSFVYRI